MALHRRSFHSLPAYLQTNYNNLSLAVTDDLLFEPEQAQFVSGYIGDTSKLSAQDLARTPLLIENSAIQQKYQFTVGVAQFDPITQTYTSGCFYDDLLNHLTLNGAITNNPNRLFSAFYYAWSPPIDYDKIVNPAQYFWTGDGDAITNGEYITKEAAGSQTFIYQYDKLTNLLVSRTVTIKIGIVDTGIAEDVSTTNRYLYLDGSLLSFRVADDITFAPNTYTDGDYVYVCRTGKNYNRPIIWVYRPSIGRWVSIAVVINITQPETPLAGMIWEDATEPPARILRIYDGIQWQLLDSGAIDPFTGEIITYTQGAGPPVNVVPTVVTYLYDTRPLTVVDTWSAQNWWRPIADLSLSDQGALSTKSQGARPILEFWGNIEPDGVTRTSRNQFPKFNVYAVLPTSVDGEIVAVDTANFPGLDNVSPVVSTIFQYETAVTIPDIILGFAYKFGTDGTALFNLDLETLPITVDSVDILGYRFFRDTTTGFVHSVWEKTDQVLLQTVDGNGLYDIPLNLQYNPDHIVTTEVSRTDYINHFASVIKSQVDFSGTPYGGNNYRFTPKDLTLNATMIDPEESLLRVMSVLQTNQLDIPDSIRQMSRDYNRMMFRFVNQLNIYWNDGTLSTPIDTLTVTPDQAVDAILTQIFLNRNSEFPFYNSVMGTYVHTVIIGGNALIYDTTPQPIYVPDTAPSIGASRPYLPQIFDDNGVTKIRGHDGSLILAFGSAVSPLDPRDVIILNLENRFFDAVPDYFKTDNTFDLHDYYGNFTPMPTAEEVTEIVSDYTTIVSPIIDQQLYSVNQQLYVTWDGGQWLTANAQVNDIFLNQADSSYYIFNGFYANKIVTFNQDYSFDYSENEFRQVIQREFERWAVTYNLDFITNNDYDANDPFTWNFSSAGIEGNWRGIYRRIYSTIRPHSHPWEVIGYSIMPTWWLTEYVPTNTAVDGTPRYADTHQMWVDFQAGLVNPLTELVSAKDAMIAPIPVDADGNLLDPVAAGIVVEAALTPSSLGDDWAYGDGSPIEQNFYDSYFYQFAVALAGYLMKTALFVDRTWTQYYRQIGNSGSNLLWNAPAIVYNNTLTRPQMAVIPSQLSLDASGNVVTNPGLNAWIAEYTNIIGLSPNVNFDQVIKNCVATLGWKTSGFINAARTTVNLLNGDEVPSDDLNVILHQGPSINEYYQSGIIVVRDVDGFRVYGTDVLNPYFVADVGVVPTSGGAIEQLESFTYDGVNIHPTIGSGSILTSSLSAGGSGYTVGSYGIINQANSSKTASFVVDTVDFNGAVLTYHIVQKGILYSVGSLVPTVTNINCTGTGLLIDILSVDTIAYDRSAITLSEITIPPSANDSASFSILINGFRLSDKYIQRIGTTTFGLDPAIKLNLGDKIVASVVNVVSNPSTAIGSFTVNNVQVTYFATGSGQLINYPYGYLFQTLNDVVNMMVGYGRYLLSQGWIFERLTNGSLRDWLGAAQAFALWSTDLSIKYSGNPVLMKDNVFQFSVMGKQTQFNAPFGMILGMEDIRNGSYGVVDVNNQPIRSDHLTVVSMSGDITVSSDNTDIFGLRLYVSEVQHVVFFPNTSTFGDIMYEPTLGLKQDAVFVDTYRTTNWTGRMEAPGFLISGGQLSQLPVGATPTPYGELFPDWEKRVADVTRFYDRFNPPDDPVLTGMARATFGYIPQTYMNELNVDDRIQFNFFRGSLKSKGTLKNYQAFVRGTTIPSTVDGKCVIAEDWAWKFAKYGDRRKVVVLFNVNQADFVDAFQAIHFDTTGEIQSTADDRVLHIPQFTPPNIPAGSFVVGQSYIIEALGNTDWVVIGAASNTVAIVFKATGVGAGTGTATDARWVNPPPQYIYQNLPYNFPVNLDNTVDFQKFLYTAAIVDQTAHAPAITLFHWDPTMGLHETLALSLIDYKTPYDPAYYNQGPLAGTGDNMLIWGSNQVGYVWWNDSSAIYGDYKQYLPDYMKVKQEWGKLLYFNATITRVDDVVTVVTLDPNTGLPAANNLINGQTVVISGADQPTYNGTIVITVATSNSFTFSVNEAADSPATGNIIIQVGVINCYEWVASPVLPSAWATYIPSQTGFDVYTGNVLNARNASYATQEVWDINGNSTTTYYFWVESNTRVIPSKNFCVNDIAGRLTSPAEYLVPHFGIIDAVNMFVFPGDDIILDNSAIEITYWWYEMPQHVEWLLIGEDDDFNKIPPLVTDKLLDSMLGTDIHGNPVPNVTLAPCEQYGTCYFPAQTVFTNTTNAINTYIAAINSLLVNIDINTIALYAGLALIDGTDANPTTGYWSKVTWWQSGINSIIYDIVVNPAELTFNTNLGLYTVGDIVKEIESDQTDPWTSAQVAAYYQYDGTNWNLVGIDNHSIAVNTNIVNTPSTFRNFFANLILSITTLQANVILFTLLYEMVRQNPMIDWFFKTSYIDIHVTQALPITPYVYPDQTTIITDAVLNLKPYRTKLRDQIATYISPEEDISLAIGETQVEMYSLIFDRLACDLTDENAWDTIPWDATVIYPENEIISVSFIGNGFQKCFILPEYVPQEDMFVFFDSRLVPPYNYTVNPIDADLCFVTAPGAGVVIEVIIDGPNQYFAEFSYAFRGDGIKNSEVLPDRVAETAIGNVFSTWNGVHQVVVSDFYLQITSDTEVVYNATPTSEIEVAGTVFGGVIDNIFVKSVYFADGLTRLFDTTVQNLDLNSVVISLNGVWQTPGIDYAVDNVTHAPNSYIGFVVTPNSGDIIIINALANPYWVVSSTFTFVGDGIKTVFPIADLDPHILPTIFVNINGIQQNINVGDFTTTPMSIIFNTPPENGSNVMFFIVWTGIGERLPGSGAYPSTIQWDWAFWDYATLGTQEFDLGGFFIGNGITESFPIPIPQTTSLLYTVVVKFFQNGVATILADLGLTMTLTKLSSGVTVFLSGPLPTDVYGALYVSRGLYEGKLIDSTTFGYQDPNGVIFAPTPSTYQHFFARFISAPIPAGAFIIGHSYTIVSVGNTNWIAIGAASNAVGVVFTATGVGAGTGTATFDPSTIMTGCPTHTPEERIQQMVEDNFTICVQTDVQTSIVV